MQRREWTGNRKALMVLAGLRGQSVASICSEHGIANRSIIKGKTNF